MGMLAIEGIVENGQIKLDKDIRLAEHTKVMVVIPDTTALPTATIRSPRLSDPKQAAFLKKKVIQVPGDAKR